MGAAKSMPAHSSYVLYATSFLGRHLRIEVNCMCAVLNTSHSKIRISRLGVLAAGFLCLSLSGCASDPAPNYFNGGYYMAGDPSCVRMSVVWQGRIMCHNSDGVATGYRDEMSPQQIQMYQYQQYNNQAQMQQLNQSIQQAGQSFQQTGQQYQPYTPPAVTPITPPGGNQIRCISTDIYTNCRY